MNAQLKKYGRILVSVVETVALQTVPAAWDTTYTKGRVPGLAGHYRTSDQ